MWLFDYHFQIHYTSITEQVYNNIIIIGIPSVWLSTHIQCRALGCLVTLFSLFCYVHALYSWQYQLSKCSDHQNFVTFTSQLVYWLAECSYSQGAVTQNCDECLCISFWTHAVNGLSSCTMLFMTCHAWISKLLIQCWWRLGTPKQIIL